MDDTNVNPIAEEQPQESPTEQNQGSEPTPEELEWSKLGGGSQERFRQVIRERNEYRKQLEQQPQPPAYVPPAPVQEPVQQQSVVSEDGKLTPEQELAIENLRKFGVLTKKDLAEFEKRQEEEEKRQQEIMSQKAQETQDSLLIENEYSRLENLHNGKDGMPSFDRVIIEEHMKATGIYNPEKAYEDLYKDEMYDSWAKSQTKQETRTYSEKPSSVASKSEPLSLDGLRERLRQPDGKVWWDKNRERLLPLVGDLIK